MALNINGRMKQVSMKWRGIDMKRNESWNNEENNG